MECSRHALEENSLSALVLTVDPERPDPEVIRRAVEVLRSGGLVAFPTETVYGLGARALDPAALARIFAAKGRPSHHPVIAHVTGEEGARGLAAVWTETASRFAHAFWPGPLTLVVPRAAHVPAAIGGGTDSIGIRAPAHAVARALIAALGEPIAAPSANRYQSLSPTRAAHVVEQLSSVVDLVLDGGACERGIESTVLDLWRDAPRVLRPGSIDLAALSRVDARVAHRQGPGPAGSEARASPGMDEKHYAPRAVLRLATSRQEALAEAEVHVASGQKVGLVLRGAPRGQDGSASLVVRALPDAPEPYARGLYATLHEVDALGVDAIVVEAPPEGEAWRAVADRLERAQTR